MATLRELYSSLYVGNLSFSRSVAAEFSRKMRLTSEEAEELVSQIQGRLERNDYEALRAFRLDSSFGYFVRIVAQRAAIDLLRNRRSHATESDLAPTGETHSGESQASEFGPDEPPFGAAGSPEVSLRRPPAGAGVFNSGSADTADRCEELLGELGSGASRA